MKWFLLLLLLVGCVQSGDVKPVEPVVPVVKTISLGEYTDALADAIPESISMSDQFELVVADLVRIKKLTDAQQKQIVSAVDSLVPIRSLTSTDADKVRGVK